MSQFNKLVHPASAHTPVIVSCLLSGLVILFLWLPVIRYYYVSEVVITDEMTEEARRSPSDQMLAHLGALRGPRTTSDSEKEQLIPRAEKLLRGILEQPDDPPTKIDFPFNPDDLDGGRAEFFLAGFGVPRMLLDAYVASGREEFFSAATSVISKWAKYELSAWLPKGYLWNDHAVANRMIVLAEFWRLYRRHPDYQPETGRIVLKLAARTSRVLANPSHFTVNTNHGVMQNLALWHFCLAFPALPQSGEYKQIALTRMRDQIAFQVSDEGVTLEHSPSYHLGGLIRLWVAIDYLALLNIPIPEEWTQKYDRAKDFYANLRLPDGSLPVFGDTSAGKNYDDRVRPFIYRENHRGRFDPLLRPRSDYNIYPTAGYSIWWDGLEHWPDPEQVSQLMVAWSHFPGHAHKHADEMSISLWARGQRWLTNTGDWPTGNKWRREAQSWSGSNAPHLAQESARSPRETKLHYRGRSKNLAFIDLERTGPQGYSVRRQVFWRKPNVWLVVDYVQGVETGYSKTIWTSSHDIQIDSGPFPNSFIYRGANGGMTLGAGFLGSEGVQMTPRKGSFSPFAGWEVFRTDVKAAPAIVIQQPARYSWSVGLWALSNGHSSWFPLTKKIQMEQWQSPDDWRIAVPLHEGEFEVQRKGDRLTVRNDRSGAIVETVKLDKHEDSNYQYRSIRKNYSAALFKYPKFEPHLGYRVKTTKLLVALVVAQEMLFLLYKRLIRRHYQAVRTLGFAAWSMGAVVLALFFDQIVELFTRLQLSF